MTTRLEVHRQMYREDCRAYTSALNAAKAEYYKLKISSSSSGQLFRMIDSLFRVKSVPHLPAHTSLETLSEQFSSYFHSKIHNLRSDLEKSELSTLELSVTLSPQPCQSSFNEFFPVSEKAVIELIEKSPPKSCSLDPVPFKIIKQNADVMTPLITKIANGSFSEGVFPTPLKRGIIHPSLKKINLDQDEYSNYRPITNIPYLAKLLERIVVRQLMNYLVENDLYASFQSAYRQFYSTETAMLRVLNDVLRIIDNRSEVVLVLLDMSSAFDTIDHTLLLERLQYRYGVGGIALQWFKSYFTERSQSVAVRGTLSTFRKLQYGVPQGSVLGPLLFSLYFGPIEDVIKAHDMNCMMYADDVQLYIAIKAVHGRSEVISKLESCVKDILIWCTKNKLACNPTKTEIVHLSSSFVKCEPLPSISIGQDLIAPVPVARDLGVAVDSHLKLTTHINTVCKSASLALRNIGRIRRYLTQEDCEKLVHAFITSRLDSCNSLLFGLPRCHLDKLQRVQNSAARLITGTKKHDHITPVLRRLHWLPVHSRIIYKILLLTYKSLKGLAPSYISELLTFSKPSRSLRSSGLNLLTVPKTNTVTFGDRAFSVCAPKLWNLLPLAIKNADSVNSFKRQLKTHLF